MTHYTATVRHHSLAAHRVIHVEGTLRQAKAAATREFGAGFVEHEIVILSGEDVVARRRIADKGWTDLEGM